MERPTRRRLLAGPATAMGLAPAAVRWLAAGPGEHINMALIGCGWVSKGDLSAFLANPEVDCPVVCDVDDGRLADSVAQVEKLRRKRPDAVKDFRAVIDRKDVDVVLVCTPDHWHALPTVYACQAGKDVYVEKPLAATIAEGRAMVEAARRHKRVVQMGTQWRSGAHYQEAVDFVRSGKLGHVRQVRAWACLDWLGGIGNPPDGEPPPGVDYNMWLGPAPERPFNPNRFHFNFRWFWDYAGGLMTDWGVHLINVALWAMGRQPPRRVSSSGGKFVAGDNTDTPDTQATVYEFPGYILIWEHQMLGGLGPGGRPHGLCFTGSEGTLILDAQGWEVLPEPKKRTLGAWRHTVDPENRAASGRPAHVRNFLDCVRSRKDPVEDVEVGHFASTVAHLGNIALRTGKKITWDPKNEQAVNCPEANRLVAYSYRKPWSLP